MKGKAQLFVPETNILTRVANAGYLAALLDRSYVGITYSKKKGKRPLHAVIQLGESHPEAKKTWPFIMKNWKVPGLLREEDLFKYKSFDLLKKVGFQKYKKKTLYLKIDDPESVIKLCEVALPYSERPERLKKVIEAAYDVLRRKGEAH